MSNENKNFPQNIIIEDKSRANISGVLDVESMDDSVVVLQTVLGELTVKGENLKITSFSGETGDLMMQGTIFGAVYSNGSSKGGFFSRIVK